MISPHLPGVLSNLKQTLTKVTEQVAPDAPSMNKRCQFAPNWRGLIQGFEWVPAGRLPHDHRAYGAG